MNDRLNNGGHVVARDDDAKARARALVTEQFAEAFRATEERDRAVADLRDVKALLTLADQRISILDSTVKLVSADRDAYMRCASAMTARIDVVLDQVVAAAEQIKEVGAGIDEATRILRPLGDGAHQAYLLLSSLRTSIENIKIDAREAAVAPQRSSEEPGADRQSRVPEVPLDLDRMTVRPDASALEVRASRR